MILSMWRKYRLFDAKIIIMTVVSVFKRDGITMEDMATAMDLGDYLLKKNEIGQTEYEYKQLEARRVLMER